MRSPLVSLLALAAVLVHPVYTLPVDLASRDSGISQNNPVISQAQKITNAPFINGALGRGGETRETINTAGGVVSSAIDGLRKRLLIHAGDLLSPIIGPSVGSTLNSFEVVHLCSHSPNSCNFDQTVKSSELDDVAGSADGEFEGFLGFYETPRLELDAIIKLIGPYSSRIVSSLIWN
ncbi:hypothetical protein BJ165DRAFT_1408129 [Panaeolus papilionaceus]|nr:hypothetical protein BJ165DRAFT_1408129 [Panaeolus papilionaceus]